MSVYTRLSDDEFFAFCALFGAPFKKAFPIAQGVKNSNWFIQTDDDKDGDFSYVFTLYEERGVDDIKKMATILHTLKDKLPIAAPLTKRVSSGEDIGENCVVRYENKAILLAPKLQGTHPKTIDAAMCLQMGAALATLHHTLNALTPAEKYGVPLYDWTKVKARETAFMPKDEASLMDDIWQAYLQLPNDLPSGLCHLDMFADNTLWDLGGGKARLTGLLDFTEVSVERYVFDLAISLNDFCTTWGDAKDGESVFFDRQKRDAFLQGYQSVRPLTDAEKAALGVTLAYAATIFWLLRLNVMHYNRSQGRAGENITVKNPDLMKRLASYHWGAL